MKTILLILLLVPFASFAQQITMTKENVSGTMVYTIDSMSAEKIYNKVLAFVQASYKSPNRLIKAQVPNEMVRLEGYMPSPTAGTAGFISRENVDLYFQYIIDVKDNKMRITVFGKQYNYASGIGELTYDFDFVFKKDGTVKDNRGKYKAAVEKAYAELVGKIYNYVTTKKEDW